MRKIAKIDSEIHNTEGHVHMHTYLQDRRDLLLPHFGTKFRSASPTKIKVLKDDIILCKKELWDDFCCAEDFHFAER
jgi:hypothetical protein